MGNVRLLLSSLLAAVVLTIAGPARAQDEIRPVHPERFERATKADADGVLQWAEHEAAKCTTCSGSGKTKCSTCDRFKDEIKHCIECKGTKETACRACAGLGAFPDPLVQVLCPGCMGAAVQACKCCGGGGQFTTESSGDRLVGCPACRGDGGWPCTVCGGKRVVDSVPLKPSLAEANEATLAKAIANADDAIAALSKFTPAGGKDARKAAKQLSKDLALAQKTFPVLKLHAKYFDHCMGRTYGGGEYKGQEEREAEVQNDFREGAKYFLQHQKRMMELARKRQEANGKLAGENKEK